MQFANGQLVVFLGDSLTEHAVAVSDAMETQTADLPPIGASVPVERYEHRGWTALLSALISLAHPERRIRYLNAGRGGDTSRLMLARLETDALAHRPQWLLLNVGVVDVRRSFQPARASEAVPLDEYTTNLATMTRWAQQRGVSIVFLEPTPHIRPPTGAPPDVTVEEVNVLTQRYAAAMAQVARQTSVGFVALFEHFQRMQATMVAQSMSLYADEVHLNLLGDLLYAQLVCAYLDNQQDLAA